MGLRSTQLSARDQYVSQRNGHDQYFFGKVYERDVVFKNVLIVTVCAEKRTDLVRLIGWNETPLRSNGRGHAFR